MIACLLTVIMGGIAAYLFIRLIATQNWQSTGGQILDSRVAEVDTSEGRSLEPRVTYAYSVSGRHYQGNRIFVGGAMSGSGAQKTVDRFLAGTSVQVFYDPNRPQDAVLERRSPVAIFLVAQSGFLALVFCGVGAALIYFGR